MDATQTTLEQNRSQFDSLVGSFTKPIVLDDTSDEESSVEVYPPPSRNGLVIAAQSNLEQSKYRLNSRVGSTTNPIVLDGTSDQESSIEVYSSLGGTCWGAFECPHPR